MCLNGRFVPSLYTHFVNKPERVHTFQPVRKLAAHSQEMVRIAYSRSTLSCNTVQPISIDGNRRRTEGTKHKSPGCAAALMQSRNLMSRRLRRV